MMRGGVKDTAEGAPKTQLAPKCNMAKALAFRVGHLHSVVPVYFAQPGRLGWLRPTGIPLTPRQLETAANQRTDSGF